MKALNYLTNKQRYIDNCNKLNIEKGLLYIIPTPSDWFRYGSSYDGQSILNLALKLNCKDTFYVYTGSPDLVADLIYKLDTNYTHDRGFIHEKSLEEILNLLECSDLVKLT